MSEFVKQIKPHFEKATIPIVNFFSKINISPNVLTISGLLFTTVASYFIYIQNFFVGAFLLTIGALFDALDGHLARRSGLSSKFGAFLDSVVDRISDFLPFLSLIFVFKDNNVILFLILTTTAFSFLTSYTRARAEGLGLDCKVGIFERPERLIILIASLFLGAVEIGIALLAVGSFITFIQRVYHVYRISSLGDKK